MGRQRYLYPVDVTEAIEARLAGLPVSARRPTFERALHRALDRSGWPRNPNEMPLTGSYWYVVVFTAHGNLRGHVGPMSDEDKARAAARSWKTAGQITNVQRTPHGPCLTNDY